MEERVVILVKNEDPLCVQKERLTKNSVFIGDLIDDENQLEMDDFEPDMVALFLTLLEDRKLTELQSSQFRELHKMATVFKVTWLKQECRNWLFTWLERKKDSEGEEAGAEEKPGKNKSDKERNKETYEDLLFVFEECLFVLRKWEGAEMDIMETFIAKRADKDNSSFVAKYLENFAKLDTIQLGWMLKLEVIDMAVFLEPLLAYIANKESLDQRIRFMLRNIDLVNCCLHNRQTFDDLFRGLRSIKELTRDDAGFILELYMETMESILTKTTKSKTSEALTTTSLSEITAMAGSSPKTAESSPKTAESSPKTAESSSITAKSSSKTAESSSRTAKSSSRTAKSSPKTRESSSRIAKSSSKTAESSPKTRESSSRTAKSSSKTAESSPKTAESSPKTAESSSSAAYSSLSTTESKSLEETSPEQKTVLFDGWEFSWFAVNSSTIWDISDLINNGEITSMFQVIELLLQVYYKMTVFPAARELAKFKEGLRTACVDRKMQKASPEYINMITSALIHSPFQQKTTLTRLLNSFIKDKILCSQTENMELQENRCIEDTQRGGYKHVFYLSRDSRRSRDSCLPDTCGFIVKGGPGGTNQYWLDELCTEEEDYQGTGLHYHGDVIARDMFYYYIWSGARAIGTRVRVPDRVLSSCKQWLPDVTNWITERVCVQYKLSN